MKIEIPLNSLVRLLEFAAERDGERRDLGLMLIELHEHDDSTLKIALVKRAAEWLGLPLE